MHRLAPCLALLLLPACGMVGAATPMRTFATNDALALARPANDFISAASEVGASLGYEIAGVDRETQTVTFDDNVGGVATMMIGKSVTRRITVTLQPGGRTIRFEITMTGNLSSTSQDKASERLAQFKSALAAKFK